MQDQHGYQTSRICGVQFGAAGSVDMQKFAISNVCGKTLLFIAQSRKILNKWLDCTPPFTLNIITDATTIDGTGKTDENLGDRGLCLDYQQVSIQYDLFVKELIFYAHF